MSNLHKFHNFIKKIFIDKYCNVTGSRVLDLCSGRGGDIFKWLSNKNISYVRGYDINPDSVKEAKKRLKGYSHFKKKPISFKVLDLSEVSLKFDKKFDVITSFFAFHYFFKNYKSINTVLKTIRDSSKSGTVLILTLFDGNLISTLPEVLETELFRINKDSKGTKGSLGRAVDVTLNNSILAVPEKEFVVEPELLQKYLKKIDFELVETKAFYEIKNKKFALNESEQLFSDLNRVYVFRKN
jgi:ubiquinone/menaquinone biosynthesis C-methylase UbiE